MRFTFFLCLLFPLICKSQKSTGCTCEGLDTLNFVTASPEAYATKGEICEVYQLVFAFQDNLKSNNYQSAETEIRKAINLFDKTSCKDKHKIVLLKKLDNVLTYQSKFSESLELNLQLKELFTKGKDTAGVVSATILIAKIYDRMLLKAQKLEKVYEAERLISLLKNDNEKVLQYTRLAQLFLHEYQDTNEKKYLDDFEKLIIDADNISKTIELNRKTAFLLNTRLASLYIYKEDWNKAKQYIYTNLRNCQPDDLPELGINHQDLSEIFFRTNQLDSAKIHIDSSLIYHEKLGAIPQMMNGHKIRNEILYKLEDYKGAYKELDLYYHLKDSLTNSENVSKIAHLEAKNDQAKSDLIISDLKRNQLFYVLLLVLVTALLAFGYLYYRQRDLKYKKLILETEQRLNRARMNPHFFFNALASLQSFALNETDNISIAENLSKFSFIMRETLENTYREYVTVHQETDFLDEYLKLQMLRFPEKFSYQITNQVKNPDELLMPSMIIQPFVENSIEHGFAGLTYKGMLNITFYTEGKKTIIEIKDNGKGLDHQIEKSKQYVSRAKQIVKDRIYLLNLKLRSDASFSLENDTKGKGVLVKIVLPEIY